MTKNRNVMADQAVGCSLQVKRFASPSSPSLLKKSKTITIKPMRSSLLILLLLEFLLAGAAFASDAPVLPPSFQEGRMAVVGQIKTWTADTMFEHINGEAELLKRYGAGQLVYVVYESGEGASLALDLIDMGAPLNAFGLYSLYAGCDGHRYPVSGATVLAGDFTFYAVFGRYFMRLDAEAPDRNGTAKDLVDGFLREFARITGAPSKLPSTVSFLKQIARDPCEVGYHPEHIDYDLESGPGYTWVGPDNVTCFLQIHRSPEAASKSASALRDKGVPEVQVRGTVIVWSRSPGDGTASYLKDVLGQTVP